MKEKIHIPLKEELLETMKTAEKSIEGTTYLVDRFKEILVRAKCLDKHQDLVQSLETWAFYTRLKLLSNAQPWSGEHALPSGFQNMQKNLVANTIKESKDSFEGLTVNLDYAINDQSHFKRGYSADGKGFSSQDVKALDTLFNGWLAENHVINKGGSLYQIDDEGSIVCDESGNEMSVNADEIRQKIAEPEGGFERYLKDKGITLISVEREYPQDAVTDKRQEVAQKALEEGVAIAQEAQNEEANADQSATPGSHS